MKKEDLVNKENIVLLPFIFPIALSLYNLLTSGMESFVVLPVGVYVNIHSMTVLCECSFFCLSFLALKGIHISYRVLVSIGLCWIAEYYDDGMWSLFYHFTHEELLGLFVQRLAVVFLFILVLKFMDRYFHRLHVTKYFFVAQVVFVLSLVWLQLSGFYELWYQFDKGFSTIDPHRMDMRGFPWMVSKIIAVFMWLLLVKRQEE